jgi:tetratricopeptide (TPR) repeat protein
VQAIEQLVEDAENLEASNRPTEAIERWRAAIAIERRPELLMRLGRLCSKHGDVDAAERLLLEAIERAPGLSDAHYYLGFLYERSGQLTRARECLERGLDLEEWGPGLTALGGVYLQLDMPLQARQAFERAQILDPADQEAWYGLGLVHRTSDHAKAIAAFRQSIAIDKDYGPSHRELGFVLFRESDFGASEASLRVALQLDELDTWAHDYLGNVLVLAGRPAEAEREFRRAIELWSDLPLFHASLGDALRAQGRLEEAERAYLHALSLDIGNHVANLRLGELLVAQGKLSTATTYLERARRAKPNDQRASRALTRLRGEDRTDDSEPHS